MKYSLGRKEIVIYFEDLNIRVYFCTVFGVKIKGIRGSQ